MNSIPICVTPRWWGSSARGGIGGTLFAAFQRFDYDFVCAIIIAIIVMIVVGEILTNAVKKVFRA
jgi:phosphonate transport system permease protein